MKKLSFLLVIITVALFSCKKEPTAPATQDVVFNAQTMPTGGLKSSNSLTVNYAKVVINGTSYYPQVFYLGGKAYTQAIKLPVGTYSVSEFLMMNDNNTPNDTTDDVIVNATPMQGSTYADFVTTPLNINFTVEAFKKAEIHIEVLEFVIVHYQDFGFIWFNAQVNTVREQIFFGDLCVKHPDDYAGSLYANQSNGVQLDMPAIFKIDVYQNGTFFKSYNNEYHADGTGWYGEGAPLHVLYNDREGETDHFEFKLFILVADGPNFHYKLFHTWNFDDDALIPAGNDSVVDFVLGNCQATTADLVLPPYMNLPATLSYRITQIPATSGEGYFESDIQNVPAGYDIQNGSWPAYCGDYSTYITVGTQYTMDVYSSLYPDDIPSLTNTNKVNFDKVNWLINHLDNYPTHTWDDVQAFIWKMVTNWDGSNEANVGSWASHPVAQAMYADAMANGVGYVPLPGQFAMVVLAQGTTLQLQIILVDP